MIIKDFINPAGVNYRERMNVLKAILNVQNEGEIVTILLNNYSFDRLLVLLAKYIKEEIDTPSIEVPRISVTEEQMKLLQNLFKLKK